MSAVTTLVATVAAAAGAVALIRVAEKRMRPLRKALNEMRKAASPTGGDVIDYEQDPESGVFRPKGGVRS